MAAASSMLVAVVSIFTSVDPKMQDDFMFEIIYGKKSLLGS